MPYWLKGFGDLGYLLGDQRIIDERALDRGGARTSRRAATSARTNLADAESGARVLDLWPNMVMLNALQSYYESTGDARVLELHDEVLPWQ